jgi:hypothetical protein
MPRIRSLVACGAVLSIIQVLAAPVASAETDVFGGTWTSTDTDGSHQQLDVRGSNPVTRAVSVYDDAASICGGAPARIPGAATIDGETMIMTGVLACIPGGTPLPGRVTIAFDYDGSTDTLTDEFGVTWFRAD